MNNLLKLKLLLKNPALDCYPITHLSNKLVEESMGLTMRIPDTGLLPFLFSCFILSLDGKLCYPDTPSGFSIAKSNKHALLAERQADLQILMLARSICDALIIGSNSLNLEHGSYMPSVTIPEFQQARVYNKLPHNPWTIVICCNLNNLNLSHQLFTDIDFPVMICCLSQIKNIPDNFTYHTLSMLYSRTQLSIKNIIHVNTDSRTMFQIFKQLGFNVILNESPFTHHSLLEQKLLHELWLNYACSYIGGNVTGIGDKQMAFTSQNHPDSEILTLHHINYNFLYSRQHILY